MVESQVFQQYPEIKREQVVIGFTSIRPSSVDLQFSSPYKDIAKSIFQELGQAIKDNDYSNLPTPSYRACNAVLLFAKKYRCNAEFVHQNKGKTVLATITPETKIERPSVLKGETVVYAKVIRTGGKEPKVEIETIDGRTLFCDASYEIAKTLGSKLYQTVGLIGIAEWDSRLNNIVEFSVKDVTEYVKISLKEAIHKLAEVSGKYYADIDDVDKYISETRGSS